jgi:hypothetical protein
MLSPIFHAAHFAVTSSAPENDLAYSLFLEGDLAVPRLPPEALDCGGSHPPLFFGEV